MSIRPFGGVLLSHAQSGWNDGILWRGWEGKRGNQARKGKDDEITFRRLDLANEFKAVTEIFD